MKLRDYQGQLITDARDALREVNTVLLQLSTGGGKTAIASYIANSAAQRGKRVFFGVHRRELLRQTMKTFQANRIPFGVIAPDMTGDHRQPIQIASIPTLGKRLAMYGIPDIYIPDEAHHSSAATWAEVFDHYVAGGARGLGLSATPERLDGTGLGKWFKRMVNGPSTAWLIDQGYLSPFRLFAPTIPDLAGVKKVAGDFNRKELAARMGVASVIGDAVAHYRQLAHGRKAMIFCVSIEASRAIVQKFQEAGYRAAHIDGMSENRDELIAAFESGRIEVLSSVDLVSEGFDLPAIEVAILLRPTSSLSLFLQQVGRVLRPVYAPGFDLSTREGRLAAIAAGPKPFALILDHAGNSIDRDAGGRGHGLPDDDRIWSLEGRQKKRRQGEDAEAEEKVPTRQCPKCFRIHHPAPKCPGCGHEYPTLGRTVEELAGELQEVDRAAQAAKRERALEQGRARDIADLVRVGRARGMSQAKAERWAGHVLKGREEKAETESAPSIDELIRIGTLRGRKDPQKWAERIWMERQTKVETRYVRA